MQGSVPIPSRNQALSGTFLCTKRHNLSENFVPIIGQGQAGYVGVLSRNLI